MKSLLCWFLLCLLCSVNVSQSADSDEVLAQIRSLSEMVSQQKTDLVSKFGEIKEGLKQKVRGMINETTSDLVSTNDDVATLQRLLNTDECLDFTHNCSSDATCTDTRTSFRCTCKSGFIGDGYTCEDIDECENEGICGQNSNCINLMGEYKCSCHEGFEKTENGTCEDIDECARDDIRCHKYAECKNTPGSFQCTCAYFSEGDGSDCKAKENMGCKDPFKAVRGIGCIHIHEQDLEFDDSRIKCKELGGDLFVAINPKHYFRLAQNFLDTMQADSKKYLWVGVKEGVWLSGRKVDPTEEAPGNPVMKTGTCSYTDGDSREKFLLWTHPCSYDWYALCEQKMTE